MNSLFRILSATVLPFAVVLGVAGTPVTATAVVTEDDRLVPVDPVPDDFGQSVAISGDVAVVGAYLDDDLGPFSGSAYVFVRTAGGWVQQAKLLAHDGEAEDLFGVSVAIAVDTIVIGSFRDDDLGENSGSAYVFVRNGTAWTEEAKLLARDGKNYDEFGTSVAISGDTIVVGTGHTNAGGNEPAAYVFVRGTGGWTQQAKLLPADGQAGCFALNVAVFNETAVVSAQQDDDLGPFSGSAYVFRRDGTTWSEETKLLASDGAADHFFGAAVAVANDTIVVGAYGNDDLGVDSGAAYVFAREGASWVEKARLLPSDGAAGHHFGVDVAVEDDVILIGATQNGTGSVHVFTRNGSGWIERSTLRPSDGWTLLAFGGSVGLSGSTAVIGAAYQAKSAYVYELKLTENQRPVANAGPDRTAECAGPGRADVTLDGSGSTDADSTPGTNDDVASFEWFEDDSLLGSGETITVPLSLGPHEIVLKVTDKAGESATDRVTVTVADTMPPTVSVSASPSSLWPPDHRMVPVNIAVVATDVCDVVPSIVLQSVASTEPQGGSRNGNGRKASDIQGAEIGTADYFVLLRAEREGSGPGRTYTVTYRATDSAGNGGVGVVEVEVPHDQRVGSRSAVKSASASQIPAF